MPIYEYECQSCGKRFDQLQRMSDPDPSDCPSCGAPQLKRAVTAAAFRLKGGGWYETDFKGDKDKKRNLVEGGESKSDSASETKSEPKTDSKSDVKPDARSESKSESKAEPKPESKASETPKPAPASSASTSPSSSGSAD